MNKNRFDVVEFSMKNRQIIFLLISILLLFGVYALIQMPKQEFPVFTIREGLVVGVYPGATSAEVDEQLTQPLERYLFGYKEVNKASTYSMSKDGMVIIDVVLNDNVKNNDEFWSKFRHGLAEFKRTLPSGVAALIASNDFGETSALLISLESKDKTYRELETYLIELESRLRQIPSVSNLRHYGIKNEQISVYLDKEKLAAYGINSAMLLTTLFTQNAITVSGTLENSDVLAPIHISETYKNEHDVAEQIIYADPDGHLIRLKDVATIVREYPQNESYITNNGNKCLLLSLEMQEGNNIVQYGKEVKKVLAEFQAELPADINIVRVADQAEVVNNSVNTFLREIIIAICTVLLVIMLLQPLRVASIAAMTIPITIFVSMGILYVLGYELNTVTLAGLLVVLGIIVDDSIVIIDNYLEKLDHGLPRWSASIDSAKELFRSILSATLAISITFYPFLFTTKGMFRDFLTAFPGTITITLFVSLVIAMLFIPVVQYSLIKMGLNASNSTKKKWRIADIIQEKYDVIIHLAFRHPRITVGIALAAIVSGVVVFIFLPQKMMPVTERNQFAVEIYLPQGAPLFETAAVADSLERILEKDPRITSITSFVGTTSPRFHTCYAPNFPSKSYAQFIVSTTTIESTVEVLDDYTEKYANHFPNAMVKFKQLDYVFARTPIEVRLSGNDLAELRRAESLVKAELRKDDNLMLVRSNFEDDLTGVKINIDNVEANRLGISKTAVATNLALRYGSGIPITTVWERDYPVSVVLKATNDSNALNFNDIPNEYISTLTGGSVPLRQIAAVEADFSSGQIVRRNGVYCLSVQAEVKRHVNLVRATQQLKTAVAKNVQLPDGVSLMWAGSEEQDEVLKPMIVNGLIIAVMIIFMILVFHFRKISLALLILGAASLSVFGGAMGILIMRMEYSLTSVLGLVALMGIIVRNGIIMYDYAEEMRLKHGMSAHDAALEAGKRRMRPIFLTSSAASMGVIPMILSNSALWAPMGTVICFGTWISMLFVVTVLPVSYWLSFNKADIKLKLIKNLKKH